MDLGTIFVDLLLDLGVLFVGVSLILLHFVDLLLDLGLIVVNVFFGEWVIFFIFGLVWSDCCRSFIGSGPLMFVDVLFDVVAWCLSFIGFWCHRCRYVVGLGALFVYFRIGLGYCL